MAIEIDDHDSPPPKPRNFTEKLPQDEQISLAERLQAKLLQEYEHRIDSGLATSTDLATIQRLLVNQGWSLDPTRMPQGLRDKMTPLDPAKDLDADVLPFRRSSTS